MRKLNSKDPTAKLLYRKLVYSNQNLKQKLENNNEYKKGHIVLPKISVNIDTNANDIYSKDYNTVHFLGYIKDKPEPTQFQEEDTIKPCWLDLFDAWCNCDTKLYRHTVYDFWNNDYKYTIKNKYKTGQDFIESLVIISIDFQMVTYDNLYVSGNNIGIFTSQEALRVIAYALSFNEEDLFNEYSICAKNLSTYDNKFKISDAIPIEDKDQVYLAHVEINGDDYNQTIGMMWCDRIESNYDGYTVLATYNDLATMIKIEAHRIRSNIRDADKINNGCAYDYEKVLLAGKDYTSFLF